MRKPKFFLTFLLMSFLCCSQDKLNQVVTKLKEDADLKHAQFSFCVIDINSGKTLAEHNSNLALVPASTMKTLTTAAALSILGKNFRFETLIQYTGTFDSTSGTLNGDLIIKGSGDPTLNSHYFKTGNDTSSITDEWAATLKKKGIKKITGKIIADNSCFENDVPGTWIWSDIGNYFGAPANGLSFNDNKYALYFKSGGVGSLTEVLYSSPQIPAMKFENTVTAGGNDDNAFIYGSPGTTHRTIRGTIPPNQSKYEVEGALPDPAWYCAYRMLRSLKSEGISAGTDIEIRNTAAPLKYKTLITHKSPTLDKIVYYTNMKSNNHYAETLLKTLALKKKGYGTTGGGTDIVMNFWKERGVNVSGLFMNDGSGLSRANAVTTSIQAAALSKVWRDSLIRQAFYESLPVSGKSGGMINIGKGSFAEGNMRAKSGYITRARSYCGYVKNTSGNMLAFSVIFNNYSCTPSEVKKKMEQLMILFCDLDQGK